MRRLALALALLLTACSAAPKPPDGVRRGWAILAERNDYKAYGMPDLDVGGGNVRRMAEVLHAAGWPPERIRVIREPDEWSLWRELERLAERVDGDDLVLFYFFGHGQWLDDPVDWFGRFPGLWREMPGSVRVLVLDTCKAGGLLAALRRDRRPHLSVGAVEAAEAAWAGERGEGMSIIGGVFTHYFAAAFSDPEADEDGDGKVSVQEAARHAAPLQREYIQRQVIVNPEYLEAFHAVGVHPEEDPEFPRVVVDDKVGEPVHLSQ